MDNPMKQKQAGPIKSLLARQISSNFQRAIPNHREAV